MSTTRTGPAPAQRAFALRLGENDLVAYARRIGRVLPKRADVEAECRRLGIVVGLDGAAIDRLCAGKTTTGVDVVVATGVAPDPGRAPTVDYRFILPQDNRSFGGDVDDGAVDFREGMLAEHVTVGAVLAVKSLGTPGTPGRSVRGREVPPREPPPARLEAGANVTLAADGMSAVAAASGTPVVRGGLVSVVVAYEVPGVSYATGNVHYDGSVVVRGDVQTGFSVCATGDVEVFGVVEGGTVLAGGNVVVHAGARHGGRIEAAGNVSLRFVDSDSEVNAVGDVAVLGGAVQCRIAAGGALVIARTAIGGVLRAATRLEVGEAGASRGTPTLLEIRHDASDADMAALRTSCDERRGHLERLARAVERATLAPTPDVKGRKWLAAERVQALVELAFAAARLEVCTQLRAASPNSGEIRVRQGPHPGVDVVLHGRVAPPQEGGPARRYVYSAAGATYDPPSWVAVAPAPPPSRTGSMPPSFRTVRPSIAPVGVGRPSILPGSRASFPPIPRIPAPPPPPRAVVAIPRQSLRPTLAPPVSWAPRKP